MGDGGGRLKVSVPRSQSGGFCLLAEAVGVRPFCRDSGRGPTNPPSIPVNPESDPGEGRPSLGEGRRNPTRRGGQLRCEDAGAQRRVTQP